MEAVELPDAAGFSPPIEAARRRWMAVLAKAPLDELERAWEALPERHSYRFLRPAEIGLVMVRGRIGGTGAPFNLGEMTATRCTVELDGAGMSGFAYVAGRDERKAELAAAFDAVLQLGVPHAAAAIDALETAQQARRRTIAGEVVPTRIEFFTMVRE